MDSGIRAGFEVPMEYDPILSKLIVQAENREAARQRMIRALENTVILGINTTIPFLLEVFKSTEFKEGRTRTDFIDRHFEGWKPDRGKADLARIAFAVHERCRVRTPAGERSLGSGPAESLANPGGMEIIGWPGASELKIGDEVKTLEWLPGEDPDQARVRIGEEEYAVRFRVVDDHQVWLQVNGRTVQAFVAGGANGKYVSIEGDVYRVEEWDRTRKRKSRAGLDETPGEVTPPMPAVVVRLLVQEGEAVVKGQGLVVVSAMKMETTLKAPVDGVVKKINTGLQAKVMPGDRLVEIEERK